MHHLLSFYSPASTEFSKMSLAASDTVSDTRCLSVCMHLDMLCALACLCVCVCLCALGLSVLGLVLMVLRELSVPGDVVMTHRVVLQAPSQQQLSHASYSHNRPQTHTYTHTLTLVFALSV